MKTITSLKLDSLFFIFNKNAEVVNIKPLFFNLNMIDTFVLKNIMKINKNKFKDAYINFLHVSNDIKIIKKKLFHNNKIKYINFSNSTSLQTIEKDSFSHNEIELLDLSNCIELKYIKDYAFNSNNIKRLRLPNNIKEIDFWAFNDNHIEYLDLLNCKNIESLNAFAFFGNPIKEIKILDNVDIDYLLPIKKRYDGININLYLSGREYFDHWYNFIDYYIKTGKRAGTYKYVNDMWIRYPML